MMMMMMNHLMCRGRIEEASALPQCIGKEITWCTKTQLKSIQGNANSSKTPHDDCVQSISTKSLNDHYCKISTNPNYDAPLLKLTVGMSDEKYIDEY